MLLEREKKSTSYQQRTGLVALAVILFIVSLPSHASAALTDGLVGYWTFDGKNTNWATNTTSDSSGQGNTGTLISMSTTTSPTLGKIGQALTFIGLNPNLTKITTLTVPTQNTMTISAWVKPKDAAGILAIVSNQIPGSNNNVGYSFWISDYGSTDKKLHLVVGNGTGFHEYNSTVLTVPNVWQHVAVTVSAVGGTNTVYLYINGVDAGGSGTDAINFLTSVAPTIGDLNYTGPDNNIYFKGAIDDVRIYNRALSATEITQLYKQGAAKLAVSPINSLTTGLVGYWTFDGKDTPWTSSTAATTLDKSGNGNTGTLTSMNQATTPVAGKIGQGLKFDGVDDYLDFGSAFNFTSGSFSFSYWVKFNSFNTNQAGQGPIPLFKGYYNSRGYYSQISQTGSVNFATNQSGAVQGTGTADGTIVTGSWYYITITRSGSSVRIYVNGVDKTATAGTHVNPASSPDPFLIGRYLTDGAPYINSMNGLIDDVRIYNRALSATEITQLYKLGAVTKAASPVTSLTTGLVGYWTFDGKNTNWAANTTSDSSGQGNTGTLTNMSTTTSPISGKIGQGLKFDGVDDYVEVPNSSSLTWGSNVSVTAWVFASPAWSQYGSVLSREASSLLQGVWITDALKVHFRQSFSIGGLTGNTTLERGKWYFVAGVLSGITRTVYLNGVSDGSDSSGGTADSTSVKWAIGTLGTTLTRDKFLGSIDDVRVYNRALSATEVAQLYKLGQSKKGVSR